MITENPSFFAKLASKIEAKVAIKTAVSAALALLVGIQFTQLFNRPDSLLSGLWCVLTAIIVSQANISETYKTAWNRFYGVLIGSIMGAVLTSILGEEIIALALGVFATVVICSLLNLKDSYRIACSSVAVIVILWGSRQDISPWVFSIFRFADSCLGIIIAVSVAHTLWPLGAIRKLRLNLAKSLRFMDQLYQIGIEEKNQDDTQQQLFGELAGEGTLLIYANRTILEDSKLEMGGDVSEYEEWAALVNDFAELYDKLFTLKIAYTEITKKMLDANLSQQIEDISKNIHFLCEEINLLLEKKPVEKSVDVKLLLQNLRDGLAAFRSTKATREYNFEDVENFFVFFYTLRFGLEKLDTIKERIIKLNDEG